MIQDRHFWTLTNIIGLLGAVLLGFGVLSLVASNWEVIPDPIKLGVVVVVFSTLELVGFWVIEKYKLTTLGLSIVLAGLLSYGGGIFLVGQIFNLPLDWSDGLFYWFLGSGAVGYLYNSKIIKYLSLAILAVAVGGHAISGMFPYFNRITNQYSDGHTIFLLSISTILTILLAKQSRRSIPTEFQHYL